MSTTLSTVSFSDFAADYVSTREALSAARDAGFKVCKYNDPVEGERFDLTDEEAADVAMYDIGLLYLAK